MKSVENWLNVQPLETISGEASCIQTRCSAVTFSPGHYHKQRTYARLFMLSRLAGPKSCSLAHITLSPAEQICTGYATESMHMYLYKRESGYMGTEYQMCAGVGLLVCLPRKTCRRAPLSSKLSVKPRPQVDVCSAHCHAVMAQTLLCLHQ